MKGGRVVDSCCLEKERWEGKGKEEYACHHLVGGWGGKGENLGEKKIIEAS